MHVILCRGRASCVAALCTAYTSSPLVPPAWGYWTFWQYDDTGNIPGISGTVDVDYFSGDMANLKNLVYP